MVHVLSLSLSLSLFAESSTTNPFPSAERTRTNIHRAYIGGKGSRMDRATWSRCNCMLIECASEYGIRMEAIQFDIPFCLRPSSLRSRHPPLPLVISSSPMHLLPTRRRRILLLLLLLLLSRRLDSSLGSSSLRLQQERTSLRRHCMRFENDFLSPPFVSSPSFPSYARSSCLAFLYVSAHTMFIAVIHYGEFRARIYEIYARLCVRAQTRRGINAT